MNTANFVPPGTQLAQAPSRWMFSPVVTITMPPSKERLREFIRTITLAAQAGERVETPLRHFFTGGICAREITIPKGAVIVGRVHKQGNLNVMLRGNITILTEDGIQTHEGGAVIASGPGTQRIGYAHEETVWMTVLATNETDPDVVFESCTFASLDDFNLACAGVQALLDTKEA